MTRLDKPGKSSSRSPAFDDGYSHYQRLLKSTDTTPKHRSV